MVAPDLKGAQYHRNVELYRYNRVHRKKVVSTRHVESALAMTRVMTNLLAEVRQPVAQWLVPERG
jgi:hypothetical protein